VLIFLLHIVKRAAFRITTTGGAKRLSSAVIPINLSATCRSIESVAPGMKLNARQKRSAKRKLSELSGGGGLSLRVDKPKSTDNFRPAKTLLS